MLDILPALFAEPVRETPPRLTSDRALAKLERGTRLLRDEVVEIDAKGFQRRWLCVCRAVAHRQESSSAARLADALRRRRLQPTEMIGHVLAGQVDEVRGCAERLGLDGGLCATVLRLALFPVLSHLAEELAPLRGEFHWDRGHCPMCGSWPVLGEFRGL